MKQKIVLKKKKKLSLEEQWEKEIQEYLDDKTSIDWTYFRWTCIAKAIGMINMDRFH